MEDEYYRTFELRRRDKNSIVEIFRPGYCDMAVSTAASVAEAKRWIDDHLDLEQTIADLLDRKKELEKELDIDSPALSLLVAFHLDEGVAKRWMGGKQIGNAEVRRILGKHPMGAPEERMQGLYSFFSATSHPNRAQLAHRFLGDGNEFVLGAIGQKI